MDTQTFEDLLDRFGGDLSRWPDDRRDAAEALLATSPAAREAKAHMDTVEACLRGGSAAVAPSGTMAAVAMRHRQARAVPRSARRAAWGAAIAAALMLGVLVGNVQSTSVDESPDQVVASALGSTGNVDVD